MSTYIFNDKEYEVSCRDHGTVGLYKVGDLKSAIITNDRHHEGCSLSVIVKLSVMEKINV